jgi:radical SAM protein with 4Fe4S-binding SPASM domain
MSNITSSPTFCSAPWTSLNIDQTGRVSPCMFAVNAIGNIKESSIQQVIQGTELANIKQHMADGLWHPTCIQCKTNELLDGASARTVRIADQITKQSIDLDITWFEPQHLVINWSNLCNLTCTYCNPHTSTAWQAIRKIPIDYVRNEHKDLIELAKQHGSKIQGLTLGGGEPLLQKGLSEFLKCLDSQSVRVLVTTNLSVDLSTNPIYQELKNWKTVEWQVSFDNANKDQFEYVRNGASWELFESNLDIMIADQQLVKAHPAYSIYCAFDLLEYYKYCIDRGLSIFWCYLDHPWDLDVCRLPLVLRQLAIEQIDQVTEQYSGQGDFAISTLQQYKQRLLDNTNLPNITQYRADPIKYNHDREQELEKSVKFQDLWPELTIQLDLHHYANKI